MKFASQQSKTVILYKTNKRDLKARKEALVLWQCKMCKNFDIIIFAFFFPVRNG